MNKKQIATYKRDETESHGQVYCTRMLWYLTFSPKSRLYYVMASHKLHHHPSDVFLFGHHQFCFLDVTVHIKSFSFVQRTLTDWNALPPHTATQLDLAKFRDVIFARLTT